MCVSCTLYIYITYKTLRKTHTSKCLLSANGSLRNARHFEFHNHVAHKTPASPNYFFWRYPSHYLHVVLTTNFSYLSKAQTDKQIDSRTRTHVCVIMYDMARPLNKAAGRSSDSHIHQSHPGRNTGSGLWSRVCSISSGDLC